MPLFYLSTLCLLTYKLRLICFIYLERERRRQEIERAKEVATMQDDKKDETNGTCIYVEILKCTYQEGISSQCQVKSKNVLKTLLTGNNC